jgi:endonuclease/exonuclease/phosphatase family metal-dependent hydrolase
MRRLLNAIAVLALLPACTAPQPQEPRELTVLSYNIHHGQGTDGRFDLERLAQVILDADADLVALQEVDLATARAGGVDQAAELAQLTGMHVVFGEAMPYDGGSYGEAVLSRWPVLSHEVLPLPASENHEPRAAVVVVVQPPWSPVALRVAGTHLDHTRDDTDRLAQVRELRKHLETGDLPTLLVGDLNATPDSAPIALLLDASWTPADPTLAPTFPADVPDRKIDWILKAPGSAGQLMGAEVLSAPVASDHCPYRARWVFP